MDDLVTPTEKPQSISDIMRELMVTAEQGDSISVGAILHIFGMRGFAFIIMMLSLLNIVIFMVPFISVLFGLPMVLLAAQMVIGLHVPIFPAFVRKQMIPREALVDGLQRGIGWVVKLEHYIRPRLTLLTHPSVDRVHGLVILLLAVMVTLPIPIFNVPPSVALVLLAIGMLQRDGVFILAAYMIAFWCLMLFRSLGHYAHSLTQ